MLDCIREKSKKFKFSVEIGVDLFGHRFMQFFSGDEKVLDIGESDGEWRMFVKPEKKPLILADMIKSCGEFHLEKIIIGESEKLSSEVKKLIAKLNERTLFS